MVLSKQGIREMNEKSVLQQIFVEGPISRIQISRNLDINKSTVSTIFNELNARQIVTEMGEGASTQAGGRKPVIIRVNEKYGFTINFDIGFQHIDVMANYIDGTAFYYSRFETDGLDVHAIIALMIKTVSRFKNPDTVNGLLAISVAFHGIVFKNEIKYSPFMDMQGVDLYTELYAALHIPIVIENEANLVATFRRDFSRSSHRTMNNIVVISIHKGIGAGIIINHKLYRGENGEAGEIGRAVYAQELKNINEAHKIEEFASQDAILDKIKQAKQLRHLNFTEVSDLYDGHDEVTVEAINEFATYIPMIIYNTVTSLNPDCVYLSSDLIENIEDLLPKIIENYALLPGDDQTDIRLLKGAKYASLLGGCSMATHLALGMMDEQLKFNYNIEDAI